MKSKSLRSTVELVLIVAVALFFALTIQAFAVKPYRIPSESMLPTLKPGQRILVDRFSHRLGGDPKLGDVTVFLPPIGADEGTCGHAGEGPFYSGGEETRRSCSKPASTHSETTFVKRVVGMPGDTIAVVGGHVIRNGKRTSEPFASGCSMAECNLNPITVPEGLVLHDGRQPRQQRRLAASGVRCRASGSSARPWCRTGRRRPPARFRASLASGLRPLLRSLKGSLRGF